MSQQNPLTIPIIWEGDPDPGLPNLPPALEIGAQALSSAIVGGLQGMIREGTDSFEALRTGKIDQKQFTYRIIRKGSESAVKQGSKALAAMSLREGMLYAAKRIGSKGLLRAARSNSAVAVCFGLVDQAVDTYRYTQGAVDKASYQVRTSENVGSTGGAIGGALAGAALGSVVPGMGTMMGALMGMLGSASGASLGRSLGEKWFGKKEENPSDSNLS